MILADKIIRLRKRNGWSQEELAAKMNVSRQAVSKWEAAQTTPDLEKILQLGNLFGVTTDYLLKDEMEDEEFTDGRLPGLCGRWQGSCLQVLWRSAVYSQTRKIDKILSHFKGRSDINTLKTKNDNCK